MLFRILETNEIKNLGLKNVNGLGWFPAVLTKKYLKNNEVGDNIIAQKDYDMVKQYLIDYFVDEEEIFGIVAEFDISETEIRNLVLEAVGDHEIEKHHIITHATLSDIQDKEITRSLKNNNRH